MRHVELITTGGTIEKTYDERTGEISNRGSIVQRMLRRLRLDHTRVHVRELMSKDSLHLTDEDRARIIKAVRAASELSDGVVLLHGTDTLCKTGEAIHAAMDPPAVPIVLTGAWRPYEMKRSDALQNLTEALLACSFLPQGTYVVAHSRVLRFPGVVKDVQRSSFVRAEELSGPHP